MSSEAAERLVAGRWTLETALRRGPSGVIWRATEVAGGRHLAVEQLRLPAPPDPGDPGQSALWDRVAVETRAAASLDHAGLVGLEDVVVEDGVVFVATELVDAALTLDELVARHGPLPVRRAAQLGLELLDALEAAHAAGLVHLDLRPGNVLVTADGRARLAGVGLATRPRATSAPGRPGPTAPTSPPNSSGATPSAPRPTSGPWGRSCGLRLKVNLRSPTRAPTPPPPRSSTPRRRRPPSPAPSPRPSTPCSPSHPAAVPASPPPAASWSRRREFAPPPTPGPVYPEPPPPGPPPPEPVRPR